MKIYLELVRDKNGRVMNVIALNHGRIERCKDGGYIQTMNGEVVAAFSDNEIVVAELRE